MNSYYKNQKMKNPHIYIGPRRVIWETTRRVQMNFNETGASTMKAAGVGDYVALAIWGDNNHSSGNNWGALDLYRGISGTNTHIGRFYTGYNDLVVQAQSDRNIRLHDNAGKGLFVEDGGNVYIGAATYPNPDCHLTIDGDNGTGYGIHTTGDIKIIKNSARILVGENTSGGGFGSLTWNHTDNTLCLGTEAGGETTQVVLDGNGKVGMGETAPTAKLHVFTGDSGFAGALDTDYDEFCIEGSGNVGMTILSPAANYGSIVFGDNADKDMGRIKYYHGDDSMQFFVNNKADDSMRIISSGRVGIGDTAPNGILHVAEANDGGETQLWLINSAGEGSSDETAAIRFGTTGDATPQDMGKIVTGREGVYSSDGARDSFMSFHTSLNASNTEKMRITSGGNVGIGTNNPAEKLTVVGAIRMTDDYTIEWGGANARINGSNANDRLKFYTGDTTRLTIDSSGNAIFGAKIALGHSGVGGPVLGVTGHIGVSGGLRIGSNSATNSGGGSLQLVEGAATGDLRVYQWNGSAWADGLIIQATTSDATFGGDVSGSSTATGSFGAGKFAGHVGIGTATITDAQLEVFAKTSGGAPPLYLRRTDNGDSASHKLITGTTDDWIIGERNDSTSNFRIYSYGTGTDVFSILRADGKVGIGTVTPTEVLDIRSTGETWLNINSDSDANSGDTDVGIYFSVDGKSIKGMVKYDQGDDAFALGYGTDKDMYIKSSGNVGIGTASPGYKLEVNGTFYSAGSSIDYKKNVKDLEVDPSLIHSLRPVSYDYKKQYKDFGYDVKDGKQMGLISEEVAETIPELAIMKDGIPKNVDYQKLSVILLKEVQNLKKEIEEMKSK